MRLFLIITIIFKLRHKGIIVIGLIGWALLVGSSGRSNVRGLLALRSWSYGCDHGWAVGGSYDRALRLLGRLLVVLIVLRLIFNISVQLHIFVIDRVVLIEGRRVVVASVVVVLVLIVDSFLRLLGDVSARSWRGCFNSVRKPFIEFQSIVMVLVLVRSGANRGLFGGLSSTPAVLASVRSDGVPFTRGRVTG